MNIFGKVRRGIEADVKPQPVEENITKEQKDRLEAIRIVHGDNWEYAWKRYLNENKTLQDDPSAKQRREEELKLKLAERAATIAKIDKQNKEAEERRRVKILAESARLSAYPQWLRDWADKNYHIKTSAELAGLVKWIIIVLSTCEKELAGKLTIKEIRRLLVMKPAANKAFRAEMFYQNLGQLLRDQEMATIPRPNIGNVLDPKALQFFKTLSEKAG